MALSRFSLQFCFLFCAFLVCVLFVVACYRLACCSVARYPIRDLLLDVIQFLALLEVNLS